MADLDRLLRSGFARTPPPEPRPGLDQRVARKLAESERRLPRWLELWPAVTGVASIAVLVLFVAPALDPATRMLLVPVSFAATLAAPELWRRYTRP